MKHSHRNIVCAFDVKTCWHIVCVCCEALVVIYCKMLHTKTGRVLYMCTVEMCSTRDGSVHQKRGVVEVVYDSSSSSSSSM